MTLIYAVIEHLPSTRTDPNPTCAHANYVHDEDEPLRAGEIILLRDQEGLGLFNVLIASIWQGVLHVVTSNKSTTRPAASSEGTS